MLKTFKYRLYPTKAQKVLIEKHFGCCRFVYNLALETKKLAYLGAKVDIGRFDLQSQLVQLKKLKEYKWLNEVNSQSLLSQLLNLENAYKAFFKGGGFPKFKTRTGNQSFQVAGATRRIDFDKATITIPKLFNIPFVVSKIFNGEIRTIIISRTPTNKYFASVLVENGKALTATKLVKKAIGVDMGLKHFLVTSEGGKIDNPRFLREDLQRLKVLQKRASKKKKGSKNKKKANFRVAILHERIKNKREDFLQKLSSKMVNENQVDTFCFESLRVKNMLRNHNLALSITDAGWSRYIEIMRYKCKWKGKNMLFIGTFEPSSKACSDCGELNQTLMLAVREWQCKGCGKIHDRDKNAAINIRRIAIENYLKNIQGKHSPVGLHEPSAIAGALKQENISSARNVA